MVLFDLNSTVSVRHSKPDKLSPLLVHCNLFVWMKARQEGSFHGAEVTPKLACRKRTIAVQDLHACSFLQKKT